MGLLDRILGRGKKAAGELANDPQLKREGAHQEQGMAEDRASMHEEQAQDARQDAAEHHAERESST